VKVYAFPKAPAPDKTRDDLAEGIAALNVETLDLSENSFNQKTGWEVGRLFSVIPAPVNTFIVSDNYLDEIASELLGAGAFDSLPTTLRKLVVTANSFEDLELPQYIQLRMAISGRLPHAEIIIEEHPERHQNPLSVQTVFNDRVIAGTPGVDAESSGPDDSP
jgi:hypothetical protein